jgi:hypothetical protein
VLNCADLMICHEVPELAHELAQAIATRSGGVARPRSPFVGAIVVPPRPGGGDLGIERCAADERWVR